MWSLLPTPRLSRSLCARMSGCRGPPAAARGGLPGGGSVGGSVQGGGADAPNTDLEVIALISQSGYQRKRRVPRDSSPKAKRRDKDSLRSSVFLCGSEDAPSPNCDSRATGAFVQILSFSRQGDGLLSPALSIPSSQFGTRGSVREPP